MPLISPGLMFSVQHPYHQGIRYSISQQSLGGSKQEPQMIAHDFSST